MEEVIQKENVADDSRFARLTEPQLRVELEDYRRRRGKRQISWRVWKSIESLIEGEIRFRKLGPID
jgi:hypothetical protein